MPFVLIAVAAAVVSGCLGTYVALQKDRPLVEGFILGLLFPALGPLIEAMLPENVTGQTDP